jgi:transcriptional regulator with XRE-family HTH domain
VRLKENLKHLIVLKDINVSQLARFTDLPINTVHNWLNGQSPQNLEQLKKVADYFEITIDDLCFGSKSNTRNDSPLKDFEDEINAGVFEVILRKVKK